VYDVKSNFCDYLILSYLIINIRKKSGRQVVEDIQCDCEKNVNIIFSLKGFVSLSGFVSSLIKKCNQLRTYTNKYPLFNGITNYILYWYQGNSLPQTLRPSSNIFYKGENYAVRYPNKQDGGCSRNVSFSLSFSEIRDVLV
jgi:hypothetical protein